MTKKVVNAALYIRSSAENPEGYIGKQVTACIDYCKANDLIIVDCFMEVGSTADESRPALTDLLRQIKTKTLNAVVVTSFDRLFRDENNAIKLIDLLSEHEITLHVVNDLVDSEPITDMTRAKEKVIHNRPKKK